MKQNPLMESAQRQMRPGMISRDGFLGADPRSLTEILDADAAEVRRLNLDHRAIAARMRELREGGLKGLGLPMVVPPHFEVQVDSVRGRLPCPFAHEGTVPKTNISVRNLRSGRSLTYTDMNIHLIEHHGFYEGRGAAFRVEPADLVDILEIPQSIGEN